MLKLILDKHLVSRLIESDPEMWKVFVYRYGAIMRRTIKNKFIVNEDVLNEIMQVLFEHLLKDECRVLKTWNGEYPLDRFLAKVAKNKASDFLRKFNREQRKDVTDENEMVCCTNSPDEVHEKIDFQRVVDRVINELRGQDDRCRKLLMLSINLEHSYKEIAEIMGMSVSNVGVYLKRCRERYFHILRELE